MRAWATFFLQQRMKFKTLMEYFTRRGISLIYIFFILITACWSGEKEPYKEWTVYGGTKDRIQYSALSQIDTTNVRHLQVAWIFNTKDAERSSQIQVNPIIIDGVLYGVSPRLKLFALDAVTGKEKWQFDPFSDATNSDKKKHGVNICRGIAFYNGGDHDRLIFYTAGSSLYSINVDTGMPVRAFGNNGSVDLHNDLGRDVEELFITATSPGIIYKDLIIIGSFVSELAAAAPGHIRAYDVHTGKLRWIFHTIPHPGEEGFDTWDDPQAYQHIGGANAWAGFSLDEEKGILYAPTGSASYDFYGGKRTGDNLFANCILALDAATGKRIWHFQTVHHDVWDMDLPTAPVLVTVKKEGQNIEAVLQVTKTGFIFLLDRLTGEPVYPVEERPVPTETDLHGEILSPTQPVPAFFQPFIRQQLTEADLNTHIPDSSYQDIQKRLSGFITGRLFNPPSKKPTVIFPGQQGGAEWGGPAFDPSTGIIYINANEIPRVITMVDVHEDAEVTPQTNLDAGRKLYTRLCESCHGTDRKGGGENPSLLTVDKKYNEKQFKELISSGVRRMPAFSHLTEPEKTALASFLLDMKAKQHIRFVVTPVVKNLYHQLPYTHAGNRPSTFLTKEGYPAIAPPWGTLMAMDLQTGKIVWKTPLGEYPELKAKGIHSGTENFGGPVVTGGGLLFIAATKDGKFRAFNKRTGEMLWETILPAAGFATPAIHEVKGKQYVVIACGGGKLNTPSGDAYVAFSLPDK